MSLNFHQQRQLDRIEYRLSRSDPRLAAMLAVFGRLAAGECLPTEEQIATRLDSLQRAATLVTKTLIAIVLTIGLLVSAVPGLLTAVFTGHRARIPQPAGPGTNGH